MLIQHPFEVQIHAWAAWDWLFLEVPKGLLLSSFPPENVNRPSFLNFMLQ